MKTVTTTLIVTTPECRGREGQREPVTVGVPLPKGLVAEADRLLLVDDNDQSLPLQAIATDRWPDGSLRWVLLDFQLIGQAVARREFALTIGADSKVTRADGLIVTEHPKQIRIDTGAARFVLRAGAAFPFAEVVVGGREQQVQSPGRLCVTDPHGTCFSAQIHALAVETR